jgi:hypothetical protein
VASVRGIGFSIALFPELVGKLASVNSLCSCCEETWKPILALPTFQPKTMTLAAPELPAFERLWAAVMKVDSIERLVVNGRLQASILCGTPFSASLVRIEVTDGLHLDTVVDQLGMLERTDGRERIELVLPVCKAETVVESYVDHRVLDF